MTIRDSSQFPKYKYMCIDYIFHFYSDENIILKIENCSKMLVWIKIIVIIINKNKKLKVRSFIFIIFHK